MQAKPKCFVARPHYLVCCINECEEMMGYIEDAIGAPVASVEDILLVAEYATAAATPRVADSYGKSFKVVTNNIETQICKFTECQASTQGKR